MNQMLRLLIQNKTAPKRFEVVASADPDEATLYLYDAIVPDAETADWYGGIDPQSFVTAIANVKAKTLHLRINSPGGDVFGARAMAEAIRECNATVMAHIDGYCASAATFLAMACDSVQMAPGSFYMIHKASTVAWGNADDFLDTAGLLDKIDDSIAQTYSKKTGIDTDQLKSLMAAETWMSAEEAVEQGFADSLSSDAVEASAENRWNLSAYKNAPRARSKPASPKTPTFTQAEFDARVQQEVAATLAAQDKAKNEHSDRLRRLEVASKAA